MREKDNNKPFISMTSQQILCSYVCSLHRPKLVYDKFNPKEEATRYRTYRSRDFYKFPCSSDSIQNLGYMKRLENFSFLPQWTSPPCTDIREGAALEWATRLKREVGEEDMIRGSLGSVGGDHRSGVEEDVTLCTLLVRRFMRRQASEGFLFPPRDYTKSDTVRLYKEEMFRVIPLEYRKEDYVYASESSRGQPLLHSRTPLSYHSPPSIKYSIAIQEMARPPQHTSFYSSHYIVLLTTPLTPLFLHVSFQHIPYKLRKHGIMCCIDFNFIFLLSYPGIRAGLYSPPSTVFDGGAANAKNGCYCLNRPCPPKGLQDTSPCYDGMPIYVSFPHFYGAEPSFREHYEGLQPNESKHGMYFAIQSTLGVAIHSAVRVQYNVKLTRAPNVYGNNTTSLPDVYVPIMWIEKQCASHSVVADLDGWR
ncbi:Protein peste [Eumeta japonica]|uniref:Protein peste n=1 Tax=Eumeta variegata TaxID=151549 RepID=A0A4C1X0T7_EUMVA|nr:Protein peste [Eumeta japonica]